MDNKTVFKKEVLRTPFEIYQSKIETLLGLMKGELTRLETFIGRTKDFYPWFGQVTAFAFSYYLGLLKDLRDEFEVKTNNDIEDSELIFKITQTNTSLRADINKIQDWLLENNKKILTPYAGLKELTPFPKLRFAENNQNFLEAEAKFWLEKLVHLEKIFFELTGYYTPCLNQINFINHGPYFTIGFHPGHVRKDLLSILEASCSPNTFYQGGNLPIIYSSSPQLKIKTSIKQNSFAAMAIHKLANGDIYFATITQDKKFSFFIFKLSP